MWDSPVIGPFKIAMRGAAASVSVVSAASGERWHAMTATSYCSVSMDPPSILVCVNRSASMHAMLHEGAEFCLNLLTERHQALSIACGTGGSEDRFSSADWEARDGTPYVVDAQSNVFCRIDRVVDHGTHSIMISSVMEVRTAEDIAPLIYLDGDYLALRRLRAS